ncbi:MAG: NADH-quinone oxidoreductase subunit C [Anaerolineales bacterium]|nr:MAG: NADH-quinone oxidoreductase subunit C [Anaerolineales bacterium]
MEDSDPMNTEEILTTARQLVAEWVWETETYRPQPHRLDVILSHNEDLLPIVVGLRVKRLGNLSAITGLDHGAEKQDLEVLYHFCTGNAVITLRVHLSRQDPHVQSLSEVIPSSEVFEREVQEMFGVQFEGLRNPMRLYLPDDWKEGVYPLRKDTVLESIIGREERRLG